MPIKKVGRATSSQNLSKKASRAASVLNSPTKVSYPTSNSNSPKKAVRSAVENTSPNVMEEASSTPDTNSLKSSGDSSESSNTQQVLPSYHIDLTVPVTKEAGHYIQLLKLKCANIDIFHPNCTYLLEDESHQQVTLSVARPLLIVNPRGNLPKNYLKHLKNYEDENGLLSAQKIYNVSAQQEVDVVLTHDVYMLDLMLMGSEHYTLELCKQHSLEQCLLPYQIYSLAIDDKFVLIIPKQKVIFISLADVETSTLMRILSNLDDHHFAADVFEAYKPYSFYCPEVEDGEEHVAYVVFKEPLHILNPAKLSPVMSDYLHTLAKEVQEPRLGKRSFYSIRNLETKNNDYIVLKETMVIRPTKNGKYKFAVEMPIPNAKIPGIKTAKLGSGSYGSVFLCAGKIKLNSYALHEFFNRSPEEAKVDKIFSDRPTGQPGMKAPMSVVCSEKEYKYMQLCAPDLKPSKPLHGTGYSVLFMKYLRGETLARIISDQNSNKKRLTIDELFDLIEAFLARLLMMDEKKILHCDLKPENTVLEEPGNYKSLKIIDFSLAKRKQTKSNAGTPQWSAPELLNGTGVNSVQSEMYSFGTILLALFATQQQYYTYSAMPRGDGSYHYAPNRPSGIDNMFSWMPHDDPASPYFLSKNIKQAIFDLVVVRLNNADPAKRPVFWEQVVKQFADIRKARNQELIELAASSEIKLAP